MAPLDFVARCPPFDVLGPQRLTRVARALEITFVPRGQLILASAGPPSSRLYIVRKGTVRLQAGGRQLMVVEPGEVFGHTSVLTGEPPVYDAIADEDVLLYGVAAPVVRELLAEPEFAWSVAAGLAERLRATSLPLPAVYADLGVPVGDLVRRAPLTLPPTASVGDVARVMRDAGVSSVLVVGAGGSSPVGIVTDRDLRGRVLAEGLDAATPVAAVMSAPVRTVSTTVPVHDALVLMLEHAVHHLPVERNGDVVGMVTDTDLLRQQARSPFALERTLGRATRPEMLAGYASEVVDLVATLVAGGLDAVQAARTATTLIDHLVRTLVRLAEDEFGPPPGRYAWLVFGSQGRGEQAVLSDQDNALVYEGDDGYFAALADRVVRGLVQAGIPECAGGFMANQWRGSLPTALGWFRGWIDAPEADALVRCSVLFDFRVVAGDLDVAPLDAVLRRAAHEDAFLAQLAASAVRFSPPLGAFGRIRAEHGGIDLKAGAIVPIVALARVLALAAGAGSGPRGTLARLDAARHAGLLSADSAETLAEAYRFVLGLRLRDQLDARRDGRQPTHVVDLDRLTTVERRHLKEALLAIHEAQEVLAVRYRTGLLG